MDYVKLWTRVSEYHSNQIDFINFVENNLEDIHRKFGVEDDKLMQTAEQLRNNIEKVKRVQGILLKELHELEMVVEMAKK
jgi:hypothetical protein